MSHHPVLAEIGEQGLVGQGPCLLRGILMGFCRLEVPRPPMHVLHGHQVAGASLLPGGGRWPLVDGLGVAGPRTFACTMSE